MAKRRTVKKKKSVRKSSKLKASKLKVEGVTEQPRIKHLRECQTFRQVRRTKEIHTRRIIPAVRKGQEVADLSPSPPCALEMPQARAFTRGAPAPLALTDNIALFRNTEIAAVAGMSTASQVLEPSVATSEPVVFYSGNWFVSAHQHHSL